jgi:transcription termination factor Rho
MAVNSSGSTDSDPEAPPRRRRPPVKKKTVVDPAADVGDERAAATEPASVVEEAPSRPVRRKVRRAEPVVESEPEGFGFDPEEFLPPAIETPAPRTTRSREPRTSSRAPRESAGRESTARESTSRESTAREPAPRESSSRERESAPRESLAPRNEPPARKAPQGDDLFNNDGDSGYSGRYYAARPTEEVEPPRRPNSRTDSRSVDSRSENRSDTRSDNRSDNRTDTRSDEVGDDRQDQDSDDNHSNGGTDAEGAEGANGDNSEFQRRRRRRRRPRSGGTGGGRESGPVNTPQPQSQSQLGAARFNNANRGAPRGDRNGSNNTGGGNRPQRGPGRGPGGSTSRDRNSSGGGSRDGATRESGPRTGGYRDRAPREYSQERGNFNEQAMADIPGTAVSGVLELHPKGYGFLRDPANNYSSAKTDPFVSGTLIERSGLREGVLIKGEAIPGPKGQGPRLKSVESVEGRTIEEYQKIKTFDTLTAINPHDQIMLETGPMPITMRVIDLLCPIGKGQRALIVAPPRTGKTMLLQDIANAVSKNHPEMYLIVLLIDERPEEVTEMRRNVRGEVIASSMDRDVESHVRISQLIIERGKRIAESGGEVFILLDSITRTARAFNKWVGSTGRTTTGGLDVKALDIPKKMFGTARLFDEGGSLTIAATALIETGSRMDDVIFQEFKGTGNMEMVLSRSLADRRIWPAIDIQQSGTRREEKILSPETLEGVTMLRRSLLSMNSVEGMEQLTKILQKYPSNKEFLSKIRSIL